MWLKDEMTVRLCTNGGFQIFYTRESRNRRYKIKVKTVHCLLNVNIRELELVTKGVESKPSQHLKLSNKVWKNMYLDVHKG